MRHENWIKWLDVVSRVLLVLGGLHLGLVGAFGFKLLTSSLGATDLYVRVVYSIIGLAALYQVAWFLQVLWKDKPKLSLGTKS